MPVSFDQPWSNGPNAPQIPHYLYKYEKGYFAGSAIAAVSYGILVALFFRCMSALLFPVHPTTKGVRWGLVAHTVAVFSFVTIAFVINRDIFSMSYINGREFTGVFPGAIGFVKSLSNRVIFFVSIPMFPFCQWLADGLLLYRCFVIYSKNYWVSAFPSLMYLISIAVGILWSYHIAKKDDSWPNYDTAYMAICVALNVLLTLMIIIRLALHIRNIRNAIGASPGLGGLYTTVITILVESSALNALAYTLHIVSTFDFAAYIFSAPLGETQAISQFLIVLRVANRTALASDAVSSRNGIGSIHFRSGGGSTGVPMSSRGETSSQVGIGVETGSEVN